MDERDEKGQFQKGHEGIGGRPPKAREQAILQIASEVVTLEKWRQIFEKAVDDAITDPDGRTRDKARRYLSEYQIGKPAQVIKLHQTSDEADEFDDFSDAELRAIIAADTAGSADSTEGTG